LYGAEALDAERDARDRANLSAPHGGYWTLRSASGLAFTRCGTFDERPGHADLLHVDIRWRGRNVALDPGTFSYNAPAPFDDGGARTRDHNTVTVDDLDQMERWGRFLWLPWARARSEGARAFPDADVEVWAGEHDGYARLRPPVSHRRAVARIGAEHWLVLDRLDAGDSVREFRIHWLLADGEHDRDGCRLRFRYPEGDYHVAVGAREAGAVADVVRAGEGTARGWAFPYYRVREPAVSLSLRVRGTRALLWSVLGPSPAEVLVEAGLVRLVTAEWCGRLVLAGDGGPGAWITGAVRDNGKDTTN
jgi:asparagine synthase (glutamine-hydrolysing)